MTDHDVAVVHVTVVEAVHVVADGVGASLGIARPHRETSEQQSIVIVA